MPRWLGVDLGTRRIGVSISDSAGRLATPYAVLQRSSDDHDARALAELAAGEGAKEIVLGHPLSLDGSRGDAALVAEAFAAKLKEVGARVKLWDERMTTVEAGKRLKGTGMNARRARAVVDKVAASVMLQSFLDARKK